MAVFLGMREPSAPGHRWVCGSPQSKRDLSEKPCVLFGSLRAFYPASNVLPCPRESYRGSDARDCPLALFDIQSLNELLRRAMFLWVRV